MAGPAHLAVGGDDFDLEEVVDGPSEPPGQVAQSTAESEAADADVGDESEWNRQAVPLRLPVHVSQPATRSHSGRARIRIDVDGRQPGQVDGQATVDQGRASDVVASAAHRKRQPPLGAYLTAAATSAAERGWTTTAGRLSTIPFHGRVASA